MLRKSSQHPPSASLSEAPPKLPEVAAQILLDNKVETILGGTLVSPAGFEFAEQMIRDAAPSLLVKAAELESMLSPKGFSIDTRICRTNLEKFSSEPVIVLTIRDQKGGYALPSANLLWDPIIEDSWNPSSEKGSIKKGRFRLSSG